MQNKVGKYFLSLPAPQLPGSSHACSVSIHTKHLRGRRRLLLLLGQVPPDSRLHHPQYLSRRAAEGPRPPCVLRSTHLAHPVSPWSQPPAARPHQGHLQPLYQADLKTHSQVNKKKRWKTAFIMFSMLFFPLQMQIEFVNFNLVFQNISRVPARTTA